jgi:hypothetical protein
MGDKVVRSENWNDELRRGLVNFATSHPDATVMLFSAWDTFTRILSGPARYGLNVDQSGLISRTPHLAFITFLRVKLPYSWLPSHHHPQLSNVTCSLFSPF